VSLRGAAPASRRRRTCLILTCAFLLGASLAPAAEPPEKPRLGWRRIGPVFVTPKLELRNAGVDTNVYNDDVGSIEDSATILAGSLGLVLPVGRRWQFDSNTRVGFNYFRREESERSTDVLSDLRARFETRRVLALIGGRRLRAKQRFSVDLDERVPREEDEVNGEVRVRLTRRLSLSARGAWEETTFQTTDVRDPLLAAELNSNLDRTARTAALDGRCALSPRTTFVTSYESSRDHFPASADQREGNARAWKWLAGFETNRRAILKGKLLAGIREFPSDDDQAAPARRDFVVQLEADSRAFPLGQVLAELERDVAYAARSATVAGEARRNSFVTTRVVAQLTSELPLDLASRLEWEHQRDAYLLPEAQEGPSQRRRATYTSVSVGIFRRLAARTWLGASIGWRWRDSTQPGRSYRGVRYGLQAEWIP
jgi:hypothetical protein